MQEADLIKLINVLLDNEHREEFESALELNISVTEEDGSRFRLNFFRQQGRTGIVVRRINTVIPTIESLGLPDVYAKMVMKKHGLIILASPGGSGKSTSMAAMVNHRNKHGSGHILTIEDPIEFVHEHGNCIITQREVGTDTYSYGMALKNALRQRADVIVIGEIRDRESMDHAMRFAETGHLCIATLHSNNAGQAVDRIVNFFPDDSRSHILSTLAQTLLCIISQKLVVNIDQNYSLAMEILLNAGLVKTLISDDRIKELGEAIERNLDTGMQTMDQALFALYENGKISLEVALSEAENASNFKLMANQKGITPAKMAQMRRKDQISDE